MAGASSSLANVEGRVEVAGVGALVVKDVTVQDQVHRSAMKEKDESSSRHVQVELVSSGPVPLSYGIGDNVEDCVEPVCSSPVPLSFVIGDAGEDCDIVGHMPGTKDPHNNLSPVMADGGKSLAGIRGTKIKHVCAICHEKIKSEDTAEIKGCEHTYCVNCILRWASYKAEPWCPQCRLPFSFLYVYRALDGTLSEYLCEESVCLLLRASWFKPLVIQEPEELEEYQDDYDVYEESYYASNLRLGNRRWGDSGYVRAGRREARPIAARQIVESGGGTSSSSRHAKGKEKEPVKESVGRRARRAQKREQLDKMSGKK